MYKSDVEVRILKNGTWPFYRASVKTVVLTVFHSKRVPTVKEVIHHLNVFGYNVGDNSITGIRQLGNPVKVALPKKEKRAAVKNTKK